jgi:hypothetical protein
LITIIFEITETNKGRGQLNWREAGL